MTDDTDPFGAFKKMFQQFGSSESGFPGTGFPMVPFPLPIQAGSPSPGDATKQTLRQLYSAMDGLSKSTSGNPMVDAWEQYTDAFDIDTTVEPEQAAALTVTTYRIWFHGLAQVLVESYTIRLVTAKLVVADHRQSTGTQQWLWGLPQSDREQLLLRCTDVDDDLVSEMQTARQRRDELLYDFSSWDDADFEESLDDARRYLGILTALDDLVTDGDGFSFYPEGVSGSNTDEADQANGDESADSNSEG